MQVTFDHDNGKCGGGEDHGDLWREGSVIHFKGTAIVPNPCYKLLLNHSFSSPGILVLEILKRSTPGMCIQCLAQIPFEGTISDLKKDIEEIVLTLDGKTIARKKLAST